MNSSVAVPENSATPGTTAGTSFAASTMPGLAEAPTVAPADLKARIVVSKVFTH